MFDACAANLWLIPALPLAAAVLTALLGPRWLRQQSHWPCLVAVILSCVVAFGVFGYVRANEPTEPERSYTWFHVAGDSGVDVGFTLRADYLTAIMLVTVTFVGSLIAIFSVGYMHDDPGYARFFAEIALFV